MRVRERERMRVRERESERVKKSYKELKYPRREREGEKNIFKNKHLIYIRDRILLKN